MTTPDFDVMVRELTGPYTHVEKLEDGRLHHVPNLPPLLAQLASLEPSPGEGVRRGFASRPVARIEAIDTLAWIDRSVRGWLTDLGADASTTLTRCVWRLYSLTPQLLPVERDIVVDDVHHWWVSARILSGWDSPPFAPRNHCPHCSELGTLRVRVDQRTAHCVACRATWNDATIGLLASWIRHENGDEAA